MLFELVNSASSCHYLIRLMLYIKINLESTIYEILAHTKDWNEHICTV